MFLVCIAQDCVQSQPPMNMFIQDMFRDFYWTSPIRHQILADFLMAPINTGKCFRGDRVIKKNVGVWSRYMEELFLVLGWCKSPPCTIILNPVTGDNHISIRDARQVWFCLVEVVAEEKKSCAPNYQHQQRFSSYLYMTWVQVLASTCFEGFIHPWFDVHGLNTDR